MLLYLIKFIELLLIELNYVTSLSGLSLQCSVTCCLGAVQVPGLSLPMNNLNIVIPINISLAVRCKNLCLDVKSLHILLCTGYN